MLLPCLIVHYFFAPRPGTCLAISVTVSDNSIVLGEAGRGGTKLVCIQVLRVWDDEDHEKKM